MAAVIVNDKGKLYEGFSSEESRPIWRVAKTQKCILDDEVADKVLSQLHQLGFTRCAKRPADGVARKWVPEDLDASGELRDGR